MGKKGRKNKKKRTAGVSESNLGVEESSLLRTVTLDEVRALPTAPNHVWLVRVSNAGSDDCSRLDIMDISNEMFHGARKGRTMMSCRCKLADSDTAVKIILNAMVEPSYEADPGDPFATFHCPRRPRFLLIDPQLNASSAYARIKEQVELTRVPVRLNAGCHYSEAHTAASEKVDPSWTFVEGLSKGPTAAIVKESLPLNRDEIWKVDIHHLEGDYEEGYFLLHIENVTKEPINVVGQGVMRTFSIPEAILATMLSPVEGFPGGAYIDGVPRRPGLILLSEAMVSGLELIQDALLGSGVEVKVHNAHSNLCGNAGCFRVTEPMQLLDCACQNISYCSKECQRTHWKRHKENCQWHKENKKRK